MLMKIKMNALLYVSRNLLYVTLCYYLEKSNIWEMVLFIFYLSNHETIRLWNIPSEKNLRKVTWPYFAECWESKFPFIKMLCPKLQTGLVQSEQKVTLWTHQLLSHFVSNNHCLACLEQHEKCYFVAEN
jgi:hypothetical protein